MKQQSDTIKQIELLFSECLEILSRKNHDYASAEDYFSNFKMSAQVAKIDVAQSILVLIGTKTARLSELIGSGKAAKNESIRDTIRDQINYLAILQAWLDLVDLKESSKQTVELLGSIPLQDKN